MTAQLAIDFARAQADEGMLRASLHAEQSQPGWLEIAYQALVDHARDHERFTSYEFRKASRLTFPTTPKALGSVFKRAAKEGIIERVGFAQDPDRHDSPAPVWRSRIYRPAEVIGGRYVQEFA